MNTTDCRLHHAIRILSLLFTPLILTTPTQVSLGQCLSPPPGAIAWWPGDGSPSDVAGANRATPMYGASYATGTVGQAFSFDGRGGYVELPDNVLSYTPLAPTNSPFTFEAWFLTSTGGVILGQQSTPVFANPYAGYSANPDNGNMPVLYVGTDGLLRCEAFWSGNVTNQLRTTALVNDGVFHHCAVTFDGTTEVLYLDGQIASSRPYQQVPYWTNYWYQLGIGYFGLDPAGARPAAPLGWFPFTGLIDEPTFYNRALSGTEVAAIFSVGSAGKCKPPVVGMTRTSTGNGNWNAAATWNPPGVPGAADDVIIRAGDAITVSATPASPVNSITFDNPSAFNHILKVNAPATLIVITSITLQSAPGNNTAALIAGSGVINCGSVAIGGTSVPSGGATTTSTLTCTISSLSISGNLAINGGVNSSGDSRNSSYFALNSGSVSIGGSAAFAIGPGSSSSSPAMYGVLDMTGLPGTGTLTFLGGNPVTGSGGSFTGYIGQPAVFGFYCYGTGIRIFYSGGVQTVFPPPGGYLNLVIAGSGVKAMGGVYCAGNLTLAGAATVATDGGSTVGGDLTIGSGTTLDMTRASSLYVAGNWLNSGTFISGASSGVTLNGTALQTITGTNTFNNLNLSGSVALTSDVTVDGTFSLGCFASLRTDTNQLTFGPGASVSFSCPLGFDCPAYVIGNVQKVFSPGAAQAFAFPIGDALGCGVLSLTSLDVAATGSLRVSTTAGDQPSVSSSGIDVARSVNRYWTIVQAGGGFGSYNATFNYQPTSLDANADPSQFIVQQLSDSGAWSPTTVLGAATTTAATIIGQTDFGSFAIGDPKQDQTITFPSPGDQTYGVAPIQLHAVASSGLPVSYAVSGLATISGNTLTITGVGSVQITASQAGNGSWNPAPPVVQTISVDYDGIDLTDPLKALADLDGDGLSNLLEFGVGTHPRNPTDAQAGLVISTIQDAGNHYSLIQFRQRTNAAGLSLQYFAEVSGDKQTWNSDAAHVVQVGVTQDTEFEWVTVRDVTPVTAAAPRFIRLRLTSGTIDTASPVWVTTANTIQGNRGSGSALSLFSQRMVRPILYAGKITSLQGTALTDANALWSNGQFGTNGTLAYVELDNGWTADIADTAAGTGSLILADSLAGNASTGDDYRIRAHFTVASLFGTNNETGLVAGANPAQADNILLLIPESQKTLTLFYYSNPSFTTFKGWVRADTFTPDPNEVVYPEQGVMVRRSVAGDISLYLSGPVKTGVTVAPVLPGYNLLGTLKSLSSVTLSNLNLYTGNPNTGVVGGLNPSVSDNLVVVQPDGTVTTHFYYYNPGGFHGWVNAQGFTLSGDTQVPAGSAFFINRQKGSAFNWTIPAE